MIIIGRLYAEPSVTAPTLFVREFWEFKARDTAHSKDFMSGERQLCKILRDRKFIVPTSQQEGMDVTLEFPTHQASDHIDWCEERQSMILNLRAQIDTSNPDFLELLLMNNWTPVNHKQAQNLYGLTLPQLITA